MTDLRTVMVGDYAERDVPASDPQTPLIIISNRVQEGNWQLVAAMLERMFAEPDVMPWEMYENMFSQTRSGKKGKQVLRVDGITFAFQRGEHSERVVYCP